MTTASRGSCILPSLENPMLNGILLGLELEGGDLRYVERLFPCCEGVGYRFDDKLGAVERCHLKKRYGRARDLMIRFYQIWGQRNPLPPHRLTPPQSAAILELVAETMKGNRSQAHVSQGKAGAPSQLWAMALAAVWRYGMNVHFVSFGTTKASEILPDHAALRGDDPPQAIFIEQVDKLWDPLEAAAFETLVALAYRSNMLLWVEFVGQVSLAASFKEGASVKSAFSRRIAQLKEKSPLEYLEPECVSRLKSMCTVPRFVESHVMD